MSTILHILSRSDWAHAQAVGTYHATSIDSEGFIHFSTAAQVQQTANNYYQGHNDLVVLVIDTDKIQHELKWELASNGQKFPHVYGELNLDAVMRVVDLPMQLDGSFKIDPAIFE